MTRSFWRVVGLWLLVPVVLLAGCAAGGGYQSAPSAGATISDVPAALRDTDPSLRQWYDRTYFNPYEMP